MHRFYHPNELIQHEKITLPKEEDHHVKHVMRVKYGDLLEIVNGQGCLAKGIYQDARSILIDHVHFEPPTEEKTILIQAFAEPKHLEWIVEKATEVGIDEIWFFQGDKSALKEISNNKKERLSKIAISALKQSKRLYLPKLSFYPSLESINPIATLYFGDPNGEIYQEVKGDRGICIGPESGLSEREKDLLKNTLKAKGITLSKNILRCETAAIIASYTISANFPLQTA